MLSDDIIGGAMAGPGIRCWELARSLAAEHDVTLVAPLSRPEELAASGVRLVAKGRGVAREWIAKSDVVVCQAATPALRRLLRRSKARFVYDAYDPTVIEGFEWCRGEPRAVRAAHLNYVAAAQSLGLVCADAVVCASERQRELWFGALTALGAVDSETYDADPALAGLVTVVPFGCSDADPVRVGIGPRERYGLTPDDVVVLWGGGVWNWFDPLTVLTAVEKLAAEGLPIRLVFMGLVHPDPRVGEIDMTRQLYAAAEASGLVGTHVFLHDGWIDYQERQAWLLDADVGVSAHGPAIEAKYAFRTRVLDYLWAGLPVVVTSGDVMADLVEQERLGTTVAPGDVDGWVDALRLLAESPGLRRQTGKRVLQVRERFRWSTVAGGLDDALRAAMARPTRSILTRRASVQSARCSSAGVRLVLAKGPRRTVRYIWLTYVRTRSSARQS